MHSPIRRRPRGFTLIELMVVVVVAGILASIAYPAYTSMIQRSRRADAMALLTAVVQAQERYRSNRATYAESPSDLNLGTEVVEKISKHYTLDITKVPDLADMAGGYVATASVVSTSPQRGDEKCAKLAVMVKGAVLTYLDAAKGATSLAESSNCWKR